MRPRLPWDVEVPLRRFTFDLVHRYWTALLATDADRTQPLPEDDLTLCQPPELRSHSTRVFSLSGEILGVLSLGSLWMELSFFDHR